MGKFDGILICSDIDRTFIGSKGQLMSRNIEAIKYFQSEGGLFTLATGRTHRYVKEMQTGIEYDAPIICTNGTVIYDLKTGKSLFEKPLCGDYDETCKSVINNYDFVNSIDAHSMEKSGSIYDDFGDSDVMKAVFVCKDEEACLNLKSKMIELHGNAYDFERSWPEGLEMRIKNSGKGVCVKMLKELLGIHTLVCVGDYENDIDMIKAADIGYAVENAVDEVKSVADRITVSCDDGAIAEIIYELEKEI